MTSCSAVQKHREICPFCLTACLIEQSFSFQPQNFRTIYLNNKEQTGLSKSVGRLRMELIDLGKTRLAASSCYEVNLFLIG